MPGEKSNTRKREYTQDIKESVSGGDCGITRMLNQLGIERLIFKHET